MSLGREEQRSLQSTEQGCLLPSESPSLPELRPAGRLAAHREALGSLSSGASLLTQLGAGAGVTRPSPMALYL